MHARLFAALALAAVSRGSVGDPGNAMASANVNSRYLVESVDVQPMGLSRLTAPLRDRLQQFVGTRLDQSRLDDAAQRLRREFPGRPVTTDVSKGSTPEQLAITFRVESRDREFKVGVSELLYQSKENFSYGLTASYRAGANRFHVGGRTGNDDLVERHTGVTGGYERRLSSRVHAGVEAAAFRSQWNPAAESAAASAADSLYRSRLRLTPSATIELFKPLTLQLGVSLERLEPQTPAVRHEFSSAVTGTLRFQRRWGLDSGTLRRFEAAYGIRTGMPSLSSDFAFSRHHATARYGMRSGHQEVLAAFQSGLLNGRAPLAERFIGGNSRILRGWNRLDLAPLGASRLAQVSVDYRWHKLRLGYDAGSVWQRSGDAALRQSVAIGVADNLWSGLSFLVAFPLREGRVEPIFIAGMNF